MTLDLRQVMDDADLPQFEFTDLAGDTRTLPHMQTLTPRQGMLALDGDLETVLRGDPERDLPGIAPDVADLLLDLPNFAVDKLVREWMQHSGMDPAAMPSGSGPAGKSPARSRSSATTRTPSKRTSRSAASRSKS